MALRIKINPDKIFECKEKFDPNKKYIPSIIQFLKENVLNRTFENEKEIKKH